MAIYAEQGFLTTGSNMLNIQTKLDLYLIPNPNHEHSQQLELKS